MSDGLNHNPMGIHFKAFPFMSITIYTPMNNMEAQCVPHAIWNAYILCKLDYVGGHKHLTKITKI